MGDTEKRPYCPACRTGNEPPGRTMADTSAKTISSSDTVAQTRAMIDQSRRLIDQSRDLIAVSPTRGLGARLGFQRAPGAMPDRRGINWRSNAR